jgi:hypothetical protein
MEDIKVKIDADTRPALEAMAQLAEAMAVFHRQVAKSFQDNANTLRRMQGVQAQAESSDLQPGDWGFPKCGVIVPGGDLKCTRDQWHSGWHTHGEGRDHVRWNDRTVAVHNPGT